MFPLKLLINKFTIVFYCSINNDGLQIYPHKMCPLSLLINKFTIVFLLYRIKNDGLQIYREDLGLIKMREVTMKCSNQS